ncbi:hypothetical protein [Mesorhizobium metallidurans]|uniref:hypothetical protein n=1 Tax=Mesorhizobium metallidurans TaxID=489722 RepID=UPI001FCB175C|nr:hypothetical protein [Mesorhizobium metallidurans]
MNAVELEGKILEIGLQKLSEAETLELVRKRKRGNTILMVVLLVFVAAVFASSFVHLRKESRGPVPSTVQRSAITNQ